MNFGLYRPIVRPEIPMIEDAGTTIDAFIGQALQQANLASVGRANRETAQRTRCTMTCGACHQHRNS